MVLLQLLVYVAGAYLVMGLGYAIWFALKGAGTRDEAARRASLRVRAILLPGAVAVWPVLVFGGWAKSPVRAPQAAGHLRMRHALVWMLLGPTLIGAIVVLLVLRPGAVASAAGGAS